MELEVTLMEMLEARHNNCIHRDADMFTFLDSTARG